MITDERPQPEDLTERLHKALKSPHLSKEQKRELSYLYGSLLLVQAALKQAMQDANV